MTNEMSATQRYQDEEYWFPYHYVTEFRKGIFKQHFSDNWGINYASTIEFMLSQIALDSPSSIIDVGCGDGRFTRELSLEFPAARIVGVDYSERAIGLAKAMNAGKAIEFLRADITTHWTDEPFDAASLMEVFEHIPLDFADAFMKGVRARLKVGGKLHMTVPHANKPLEYKHYQHFTTATLLPYLENDFRIERVVPFERRSPLRRLINSALQNRLFVLHNQRMLNWIYAYYKRNLFDCSDEHECQRIYVEAVAK